MKPFLLALCALAAGAAEYFPLRQGNTWTYRDTATGAEFTVRVGTPVYARERVFHQLRGYLDRPVLARYNDRHQLVALDEETDNEVILTVFEPLDRIGWNAPFRQCEQDGFTDSKRQDYNGPTGQFPEVLNVHYRSYGCADAGVVREQYAENIGMLRRTVATIAGPRSYDLVYARIGNLEVNAAPSVAFSATLFPEANGDRTVLLRLRHMPPAGIQLAFKSSQEYEVVVRDNTGRTLWRWSDDKGFTAAVTERIIGPDWAIPVRIPAGVFPSGHIAPNTLFIQSWLTTTTVDTQYAVTIPVPEQGQPE